MSSILLTPYAGVFGASPLPEIHEYWRVKGVTAGSFVGGALAELEFRATIGGADQATGGTSISGSEFNGSLVDGNAFDDDGSTAWAGTSLALSWVGYQFTSPVSVEEISITSREASNGAQTWVDFDLEYSDDGSAWTTHWNILSSTWGNAETRTFTAP